MASDSEMTDFLHGVVGVVEANSFEHLCLWQEYRSRVAWSDRMSGFGEIIGHLADMPVCISLRTSTVDGHKLLFVDATSQVVDWRMVDAWLDKMMPQSARRDNGSVNRVNAMNFHNVFPRRVPTGDNRHGD